MKIEKLSPNSYRVRRTMNKHQYTLYFDHLPTKREVELQFVKSVNETTVSSVKNTFNECFEKYLNMKSNVLSPSTLRGYRMTYKMIPETFKDMTMCSITQIDIQTMVNNLTKSKSPKTVRNIHGLISAVFKTFRPELTLYTTLPTKPVNEPYIPTDEEVKAILKEVKGTEYEIPISLACMGLRLSEICGATIDDLNGNDLYIHRAKIMASDGHYMVKEFNKTAKSTRHVILPDKLVNLIREKGYIYEGHPNVIRKNLISAEKKLGITQFTLHTLRHYFATYAHDIGMTDAQIEEMGGWASDHIMKSVYRRARNLETAQGKAVNFVGNLLE